MLKRPTQVMLVATEGLGPQPQITFLTKPRALEILRKKICFKSFLIKVWEFVGSGANAIKSGACHYNLTFSADVAMHRETLQKVN